MSSGFISFLIVNGIIIAVVLVIVDRYKTKIKFYQAVLSGDYVDILHFLMITSYRKQNKICCPWYIDYIKKGLRTHFNSRLNVRATSSRVTRIEAFFNLAEKEVANKAPRLEHADSYWKPIYEQLKIVILDCGPAYFAYDYLNSLVDKENEEGSARKFILDFYDECANSKDEQTKKQFLTFVDLVNEEIDKYQLYDIPQEKKDLVARNKLFVKSSATTLTKVWATTNP